MGLEQDVQVNNIAGAVELLAKSNIIGIVFSGSSGEILDANDEFLRIVGYSRQDLEAGRLNWKTLTAPEWLEATYKAIAPLPVTGSIPAFEKEYVRKDGSRVPVLLGIAGLPGPGAPGIAFVIDLSVRKRAQAERDRLMVERIAMLDSAGEGIFGMDKSGHCTFINRAGLRMLGYEQDECLGRTMHELCHSRRPDGSPYPAEECPVFSALRDAQGVRVSDDLVWRKNGTPLPVEYSAFPIIAHGHTEGAVVSFKDISERKQTEARLRASEERFRSAFAHASAGLFITDLEGRFVEVNRAFCQMLGRDEAELLGTPYQNVAHFERPRAGPANLGRICSARKFPGTSARSASCERTEICGGPRSAPR